MNLPTARRMACQRPLAAVLGTLVLGAWGTYVAAQGGMGQQGPGVRQFVGTYDWGSRFYDDEFTDKYEFENNCDAPVVLTFNTTGVSFLSIKPSDWTAKPGRTEVPVTITTPPWPDRPQCTDLTGVLIVSSSGYDAEDGVCHPSQRSYTVTAHVHWWDRPPPPPKLKVAGPDACTVWWNTGLRPQAALDQTCLDTIRRLGALYRDWVLAAAAGQPPEEWSWLPSAAQVVSMSIDGLLKMKERADQLLGVTP
jgi:hypothetical protein